MPVNPDSLKISRNPKFQELNPVAESTLGCPGPVRAALHLIKLIYHTTIIDFNILDKVQDKSIFLHGSLKILLLAEDSLSANRGEL